MKKTGIILFICLLLLVIACSKTRTAPANKSTNYLSGRWVQQPPDGIMFYAGSFHIYSFKNDSFQAKITYWWDSYDICGFEMDDYIRGTYSISGDSIKFTGKMCDTLYQSLQPDCSGNADYWAQYKFTKDDTMIVLNPDHAADYQDIVLKKK